MHQKRMMAQNYKQRFVIEKIGVQSGRSNDEQSGSRDERRWSF